MALHKIKKQFSFSFRNGYNQQFLMEPVKLTKGREGENDLDQGLASFFCKGPNGKHFRLSGPIQSLSQVLNSVVVAQEQP